MNPLVLDHVHVMLHGSCLFLFVAIVAIVVVVVVVSLSLSHSLSHSVSQSALKYNLLSLADSNLCSVSALGSLCSSAYHHGTGQETTNK